MVEELRTEGTLPRIFQDECRDENGGRIRDVWIILSENREMRVKFWRHVFLFCDCFIAVA